MTFAQLRLALLAIAIVATAALMPAQADTYWHLRAGQQLFQTGHVPLVETYSHTARGLPWPNHEWLWQALSYGLVRIGGMPLLSAAGAALATAACVLSYRLMRTRASVSFCLSLVGIPLASVVWALRPQIASLALLAALLHLLQAGRWWWIPPLFLLWANLHGAVALGGLILVTATGVAALTDRVRLRPLLLTTVAAGLITAATPMGPGLWRFIGESMARSRQNQIMEWLPALPKGPIEICFWIGAVVFVVTLARRWRRLDSWSDRVVVAAALVMLPLAIRAVRNISPFFLVWAPAMSRLIGPDAGLRLPGFLHGNRAGSPAPPSPDHPRFNLALALGAAAGALIVVATCWARPVERLGWRPLSPAAAAAIRACPGPLYNRYNEGGYLIWFVPEVPVFVDSRQDPYPAELLTAHATAERTGDATALFARHHVACAALPPTSKVAERLRTQTAAWTTLYADAAWVVLARRDAAQRLPPL
jgi:hypothetical protein